MEELGGPVREECPRAGTLSRAEFSPACGDSPEPPTASSRANRLTRSAPSPHDRLVVGISRLGVGARTQEFQSVTVLLSCLILFKTRLEPHTADLCLF